MVSSSHTQENTESCECLHIVLARLCLMRRLDINKAQLPRQVQPVACHGPAIDKDDI